MKKIILALSALTILACSAVAAVGPQINGNQINPQTAISIATFTVTGAGGMSVTNSVTASSFTATGSGFKGAATGLTGTAASLTAGNVTTNANLSGDVTSVGNVTTAAATQANITTLSGLTTISHAYSSTAQASFTNTASTQAAFSGFSPTAGARANSGSISVGNNQQFQGLLDYDDSGSTKFNIVNTYDIVTSAINFKVRTDNPANAKTAMTILGSGNVGIGTTGAGRLLNVLGNTNNEIIRADRNSLGDGIGIGVDSQGAHNHGAIYMGGTEVAATYGGGWAIGGYATQTGDPPANGLAVSGSVGIGIAIPTSPLHVTFAGSGSTWIQKLTNTSALAGDIGELIGVGPNSADTTSRLVAFFDAGNNTAQGTITRNGAAAVAYNTTSDRRMKENIRAATSGIGSVMRLRVVNFNFKNDNAKRRVNGLIAQDTATVYPDAVSKTDNGINPLGPNDAPWGMDYGRLTPLLIKAIQDQQKEINELHKRLRALELK